MSARRIASAAMTVAWGLLFNWLCIRREKAAVSAQEFVLLDAEGHPAARLGLGEHAEPVLSFIYPHGGTHKPRLEMGLQMAGAPYVILRDELSSANEPGVELELVNENMPGTPMLRISATSPKAERSGSLELGLGLDGRAKLTLSDWEGTQQLTGKQGK